MLNIFGLLVIVVVIAGVAYVRIAPIRATAIDFATLALSQKPNQYLVCPVELCKISTPNRQSMDFDLPAVELLAHWQSVAEAAPRTVRHPIGGEPDEQMTFVQRSAWMAFPDIITIAVVDRGNGKSSFAVYSRAIYGRKDFGVNKARIDGWIERLQNRLSGPAK